VTHGYVRAPADWERVSERRVLGFVTEQTFRRPDGTLVRWNSRAHRKRGRAPRSGSTWWAPRALAWWIAALLQYIEVTLAPRTIGTPETIAPKRLLLGIEPARVDWWAAVVQLVGTVFFNVTTFAAFLQNLTAQQQRRIVWTPDALGSICFLVASWLAYAEAGHRVVSWRPRRRSWWIATLNLLGSIAFGVSAVASFVRPATGDYVSLFLTNLGTFVGAICFLAGAVLLMPERTHPDG